MTRRLIAAAALVGALAAACTSAETGSSPAAGGYDEAAEQEPAGGVADAGEDVTVALGNPELPGIGERVIKDADLRLEVDRFKDALQRVTQIATAHGGFLVSSTVEGEEARSGTLVLRIPTDAFERALTEIRELGTVERETVSGEDVSQEFVDLGARLRNLTAQEAVLLRLMDEADTISDTIKVQRELTGIQLEVERIRGRLAFLEDRTTYGTIAVSLAEPGAVPAAEPGAIQRGWQQAVAGFLGVVSGLIAFLGVALPVGTLALLVLLVVRRLVPRFATRP
jgi:hypothetical protein